jgi:hypothetical protein
MMSTFDQLKEVDMLTTCLISKVCLPPSIWTHKVIP